MQWNVKNEKLKAILRNKDCKEKYSSNIKKFQIKNAFKFVNLVYSIIYPINILAITDFKVKSVNS